MALACMITISGFNTEHFLNIFYQSVLVINVFDNCSLKQIKGGGGAKPNKHFCLCLNFQCLHHAYLKFANTRGQGAKISSHDSDASGLINSLDEDVVIM